jgi:hypothetical protein
LPPEAPSRAPDRGRSRCVTNLAGRWMCQYPVPSRVPACPASSWRAAVFSASGDGARPQPNRCIKQQTSSAARFTAGRFSYAAQIWRERLAGHALARAGTGSFRSAYPPGAAQKQTSNNRRLVPGSDICTAANSSTIRSPHRCARATEAVGRGRAPLQS